MANYYGMTRTNYFHVNNPEALRELIKKVVGDENDIELWEDKDKFGKPIFAFGGYASIEGIHPIDNKNNDADQDDEDDDNYNYDEPDYDLFVSELQKLIVDGEAIIITEVGAEKLRYLTAYSVVITKNDAQNVDLERQAIKKAGEMLGNPECYTKNCY